ncbi:uncharacterized protein LOC130741398 [Lotus japonicus]|uniref:uncharacterized protein LOC130741398 n=1 Tax=Lotus japonicus TaxID=34305 RepID=UPI00258898F5|nr:uncharacterized protein LOC130741398 [Lotus japonicus]
MEPGMRSGNSGAVVKNRNSSGCLIVRKKGDGLGGAAAATAAGVGSSNSRKLYESMKRPNINNVPFTDSESSDELSLPMPKRHVRRLGPETIRVGNSGMIGRSEVISKRGRMEQQVRGNGEGMIAEDGLDWRERKRGRLDMNVSDYGEHEGMDVEKMRRRRYEDSGVGFAGGRFMPHSARGGVDREFETGSSRHIADMRRSLYYDRPSPSGVYPGDNVDHNRFQMNRDGTHLPQPLMRERFNSDKPIRIQGKNGVLKVMVNRKKVGMPLEHYDIRKPVDSNQRFDLSRPVDSKQRLKTEGTPRRNVLSHPSSYSEAKPVEKPALLGRPEKKQIASRKSLSIKDTKHDRWDSDNSDRSLNPGMVNAEAHRPAKRIISEIEQTPVHENVPTTTTKDGKIKRGSGTEKQKLREKIREMLLNAGWTIDYRPRRNRDYLDAVYINSSGTAYWSIIKAYEALLKQTGDGVNEAKPTGDSSSFAPIADDVLSQLTRKTRKKMEKELKMKKKKKYDCKSDGEKEPHIRRSTSKKHDMNSMDSDSNEEKLSSFIKQQQGSKSMKNKLIENTIVSASSKSQNATDHSNDGMEKPLAGCSPHLLNGQQSRKDGRCALLARSSNEGLNSESDGFIPYTGKRTVLSWLIDSGTVELRKKVQYRRRKKVLLEGWITRDGIHCGCCSKILTVSKFELHAGSKLRQPYQNIFLESGVSLLQCQIDAWNKQDNSGKIGFNSVNTNGDDSDDDTCGKCGDGGDLICCDGCPSTFHQSCLDIQMLPPGEWHCPNCTCKFCGISSGASKKEVDTPVHVLNTCSLCEKKYHSSCTTEMDVLPDNFNTSGLSFCGKECKELFEHLKKFLGTKHELEAGFSWSLIHRTDGDSDVGITGITQRVECNSKLAIALTVMDECFLPVIDRRSGINLIHNVLYNSGSNFSRLNYRGFYTAILERGDEIISAASIRFHGTKLAEMPFIGTRQMYRRQGMCRRLFSAIELVLCSLKVEKLVVPAITEFLHTWTTVFGFTHLEESLRKEIKSLNMLVFPGIDMLQKLLVEQGKYERNTTAAGLEKMRNEDDVFIKTKMSNKSDMDSLALDDPHGSDDASSDPDDEMDDEYSDASLELNNQVPVDRTLYPKSHSEERLSDSVSDKCVSPKTSDGAPEMKNKVVMAPSVHDLNPSSKYQSKSHSEERLSHSVSDKCVSPKTSDGAPEMKNKIVMPPSVHDLNPSSKSHSEERLSDSVSDKCVSPKTTDGAPEMKNQIVLTHSAHKLNPSSSKCQSKSHSEERLSDSVSDKCVSPKTSDGGPEMKKQIVLAPSVHKLNPSSSKCQSNSHSEERLSDSVSDKCVSPKFSDGVPEMKNQIVMAPSAHKLNSLSSKSHSEERSSDSVSNKCVSPDTSDGIPEMKNQIVRAPSVHKLNPSSSKSHSEERSSDSVSDKRVSPKTSDGAPEMKKQIVMAPSVHALNPSSSKSHSEERSSDSVSDKCVSPETSDGAPEMNNQIVMAPSVHALNPCSSKSHSEERSSDSVSDKCVSPKTSDGAPEMKNQIVMAPSVHALNPSSSKCQSISLNDTSVSSQPLDVPKCHEVQALTQETACSDPCSLEVRDSKCHSFTGMNCDSSELDINRALDSQVADDNHASKDVNMTDANEVLEAVPSGN